MATEHKNDSQYATENDQRDEHANDETSATQEVQRQVQAKPISSAAIAVGVGVGAGLLLSTLFSSERSRQERLARRMGSYFAGGGNLRSSIENILPNAITDRYLS